MAILHTDESWRLILLDGIQLLHPDGQHVRAGRKVQALLAYLAGQRGRSARREVLAALLWPNVDEFQGRASLRQVLSAVRKMQGDGPSLLVSDEATVSLGRIEIDLWRFEALANGGETTRQEAASLYHADMMAGFSLPESGGFNDWLAVEQARWREKAVGIFGALIDDARAERRPLDVGVQAALRLLALEPFNEAAHRALMFFHVRQGRSGQALQQFRELTRLLRRELQVDPEEQTLRLVQQLRLERRSGGVRDPTGDAEPTAVVAAAPLIEPVNAKPRRLSPRRLTAAGLGLAALGAVVAIVVPLITRPSSSVALSSVRSIVQGDVRATRPALSPDGRHVAYVLRRGAAGELYIAASDGVGAPVRLAGTTGYKDYPAWRPDGQALAFFRGRPGGRCEILLQPFPTGEATAVGECLSSVARGLTWSADGSALYFSDASAGQRERIFRLDLATRAMTPVTSPSDKVLGDWDPVVSWGGRKLAFRRQINSTSAQLIVRDLRSGDEQSLTDGKEPVWGHAWTRDDKALVYSSGVEGKGAIWRIEASGGRPASRLSPGLTQYGRVTAARDRNLIVFEAIEQHRSLLHLDAAQQIRGVRGVGDAAASVRAFAEAPNRDKVAVIRRIGAEQLWLYPVNGAPRVLAGGGDARFSDPVWSPDGRSLAYVCTRLTQPDLCVLDLASGKERYLTRDAASDHGPAWSSDGQHIYFGSMRGDQQWRVWKIDAGGRDAARPITPPGIRIGRPDDASRFFYYAKVQRPGIWRRAMGSSGLVGAETQIIDDLSGADECNWHLDGEGIVYASRAEGDPDGLVRRWTNRGVATTVASVRNLSFDHAIERSGRDLLILSEKYSVNLVGAELIP